MISLRWCSAGVVALGLCGAAQAGGLGVLGTPVPVTMVGDANGDGIANGLDLQIVQQNLDHPGSLAQGDFDGNGLVNTADLTLLNNNFQRRLPAALFGRVADRTTALPGGNGNYLQVAGAVMDRLGTVAFMGSGVSNIGVYRWSNGLLAKVADNTTPIPTGFGNFSNFGQPAVSAGKMVFDGIASGQEGIFAYGNGALTKVANQSTVRPDGGTFSSFGDPKLVNGTTVWMSSGAVFSQTGATLSQIINVPTAIPGGTGNFTRIETPTTDGSSYWFVGRGIAQFGIYKKSGGVLSTLLDQNTIVAGTTSRFTSVGNLSSDGGVNMSFTGEFANASGVFDLMGSTLSKIADTSTKIPGGDGLFTTFGVSSAGGSSVAFVGFDQNRKPGIYAWIGGELNRVIDSSVSLGGRIISSLDMTTTAVAGNKLVFKADFTDGSSGVYTASLFPTRVPGDVNNDGKVDAADFAIVQKNLGTIGGRSLGDLNGDGTIDFLDYQVLERNFGHSGIAPLLGDANGDGIVDRTDLKMLLSNFGKYGSIAQADFNGDGKVDFADYQALELNYGKVSAAVYEPFGAAGVGADEVLAASTPEPGGVGIVLMAVGALAARRRGRARIR